MTQETMRCEEALRLLAAWLDGELDGREQDGVERHLHTCRSCWSRADFERRLKTQLAELRQHPVEPGFRARIDRLLDDFVRPAGP